MGKAVPAILLSGDHAKVDLWRREQSLLRTKERRPDLYEKYMKEHPEADPAARRDKRRAARKQQPKAEHCEGPEAGRCEDPQAEPCEEPQAVQNEEPPVLDYKMLDYHRSLC